MISDHHFTKCSTYFVVKLCWVRFCLLICESKFFLKELHNICVNSALEELKRY